MEESDEKEKKEKKTKKKDKVKESEDPQKITKQERKSNMNVQFLLNTSVLSA